MSTVAIARRRTYAIVALVVVLVQKATSYFILANSDRLQDKLDLALNIESVVFYWLIPIAIVLLFERKGLASLGLTFGRWRPLIHGIAAVLGILVPFLLLGSTWTLFLLVLEQIFFIAVAEEIFWRGYFQARLSEWIGSTAGLLIASLMFGLAHWVTLLAKSGRLVFPGALTIFLQAVAGGLITGFLFLKSKSIVPGSIFHLFGNVFLFRLIEAFS